MASVLDEPGMSGRTTAGIARFSVARYHQMIEAGVIGAADRLELLEGVLVDKLTEGPRHAAVVTVLARLLTIRLGFGRWFVRVQHPITTEDSEPEPDLAIVAEADFYDRHPSGVDVAAVIEVADSSLYRDRMTKQRVYAAGGVERYVIVNLAAATVEVYRDPVRDPEPRYATTQRLTSGPVDLGALVVDAAELIAALNP